ncbi:signal peptidase II [Calothrix sp. PCC 6303]|uniref:signal peptidase II n=1 Tax=Calothrix sp. PCC 6303 TaxID=1170562 RepID=UPI0002A0152E|nr:signal peptidase II [Calothrix sp. PCC 6303]AFZ02230.1 signal peptidase II [Calothrix sp. PCC 6303]
MHLKNRDFWICAVTTFVLDQITKYWIVQTFEVQQTAAIIPEIFHFTYVTNTGAAFSILSGKVEWLRWLSLAVSIALILLACLGPTLRRWEELGYGFILGGAMGNGIDRFIRGYVVDFLDFKLIDFPVFNFADIFINVGIICLLISSFQKTPTSKHKSH